MNTYYSAAMLCCCCPLKLSASQLPVHSMPKGLVVHSFAYAIYHAKNVIVGPCIVKEKFPCISLGHSGSCMSSYSLRAVHRQKEMPNVVEFCKEKIVSDLSEKPNLAGEMEVENHASKYFESDDDKETQRRRKIGQGNKGKVPWNKGRKHSEETRQRIRQRTKEAMKNPKVRKKMSECPRAHSHQTIAKIRASHMNLWSKRLRWKRSRQKFLESWADAIAKAAKIGFGDQQKLGWNSYDKIKREISLQQKHEAAERAKAKEVARMKAEIAAQLKAERMAMLEEKRKEQELNAETRGESIRKRNKKSKEELEKLAEFQEVKLKERLMKIHRKKSSINQVSNQLPRYWENIDVDLVKSEQLQKDVSLEDQIRTAKNRKIR